MLKPTLALTNDQIESFKQNGFLRLDQISPPAEVEFIREIYDRLFAAKTGRKQGAFFDFATSDEEDKPQTSPQLIDPVRFAPELRDTLFRANALAIALQLLGPASYGSFEHAIMKLPGIGAPTPWHQDEAFRLNYPRGYDELSIWMPLQDVDESSGCLEFIPGSHRRAVLHHESPGNDPRVHALVCTGDFDASTAVACPLSAGGCTIHHTRTLHHAGANRSPNPRRAYILGFALPVKSDYKTARPFPWNSEKKMASEERKQQWLRNGGYAVEFMRKVERKLSRISRR